jgi:eukaryotic-like serine/threonine-protein kinase
MIDQPASERSIFLEAIDLPTPEGRAAYLEAACGGDARLRADVEALLAAHDRLGGPASGAGPTGTADATAERPVAVVGPYRLLQEIGEGGMGTVYLAEQVMPVRRRVALKIIRPGMDSRQVVARFEAERQALALMDHPNIARVLDAGSTDSGRPYFVMELVEGVPITRFCDGCRLTPRERLELLIPVCQAVQHAHQKGIIHRDLKPSNVLVALYDGRPVPKVIDFGVAKAIGPDRAERTIFTEFGAVIGTLEYMSPEQAELDQLDVDTRSDVYALGVLLYELLTATTPLQLQRGPEDESSLLEVLRIIREEDPPLPSARLSAAGDLPGIAAARGLEPRKLSGTVRGELDWIAMKCLEKDRARRYETAHGLAMDLGRYLRDEPVRACPPGASYRLRKFLRRHRAGALMAAVFVTLLAVASVVSTWQAVRATGAERLARAAAETERRARRAEAAQRRQAEAVAGFLESVLEGLNPIQAKLDLEGRLDVVGADLEKERAGEPLVRARLRYALGTTLSGLGEYMAGP